jgi:hypothetical protein
MSNEQQREAIEEKLADARTLARMSTVTCDIASDTLERHGKIIPGSDSLRRHHATEAAASSARVAARTARDAANLLEQAATMIEKL